MTRLLLNLILDTLFGKQEKIERRTAPQPTKPSPMQGRDKAQEGQPAAHLTTTGLRHLRGRAMRRYPPIKSGSHTGWSPGRNRGLQAKFRRLVLARDNNTCRRCGHHDETGRTLQAHHVQAGYSTECGLTLCRDCHRVLDRHAR